MFTRILILLAVLAGPARADRSVALLPLDADAKLEIYGQPLAAELARVLIAAQIEVVVVKAKMTVPEHALLVVDGTIRNIKGSIVVAVRVRDPSTGTVVHQLESAPAPLGSLDKAAAELFAKLVPMVKDKLAALAKQPPVVVDPPPVEHPGPKFVPPKPLIVAIGHGKSTPEAVEPFRAALADQVSGWVLAHHRTPTVTDPAVLVPKLAAQTVAQSTADRALLFEVLGYSETQARYGNVPLARARVRVRIADAGQVLFDRVVVTDTIVGDREMASDQLAIRAAREVLAIVRPHVRKLVPGWP